MEQTNQQSEQQSSEKIKQQYEKITELIEKYEKESVGMEKIAIIPLPEYATMNVSRFRKMSPEELAEASFALSQYTLNLQRIINSHHSWITWAKSKLDEVSAIELEKIDGPYGWNERMLIARTKPAICKEINKFMREIQMKLDRLQYLPKELGRMSEIITNMSFIAKRRETTYEKAG